MSTGDDDDDLEIEVHETLLPSLHLSVLGGVGGVNAVGLAEPLTPLPDSLSQPGFATGSGVPVVVDEPGSKPRGARTGDVIGSRYVVEGQLGRGGMGRVMRVRHQVLGKAFALKLIKAPIATDPR